MYDMGMDGTKWSIFTISVDLFSQKSFEAVSVRDIAKVAGIRASSIYYHFASKDDILLAIYEYFDYYYDFFLPPLSQILSCIGKEPIHKSIYKAVLHEFNGNKDIMDKISLIVFSRFYFDKTAQKAVINSVFTLSDGRLTKVLQAMADKRVIPPIDVEALALIINCLSHSATIRNAANAIKDPSLYNRSIVMICENLLNLNTASKR